MTFKEFQATGRAVADLREDDFIRAQLYDADAPIPGRIYESGFFIEGPCEAGLYYLTIGNQSVSSVSLERLERAMYDFALTEGYLS